MEIQKLQKFTGEHQQFKISLEETQVNNAHPGGKKSKSISPGTDFVGLIFAGELSEVDSVRVLRQGLLEKKSMSSCLLIVGTLFIWFLSLCS